MWAALRQGNAAVRARLFREARGRAMLERMTRLPVVFLPHGGGPWPFVEMAFGTPGEKRELADYLRSIASLPAERPRALIAVVHGTGEHSGRYGALADALVARRFTVVALDLPGNGEAAGPRGDWPSWSDIRDRVIPSMFTVTRGMPGQPVDLPVVLLGHSMGGLLALDYALAHPKTLLGVVASGAAIKSPPPPGAKVLLGRLVGAVIKVESGFQTRARSPKGAMGLMQLMPDTARRYAVGRPYDPATNIDAGTRHLRSLLDRFPLDLALAAYNAGEATVSRFQGIPPYPETRDYVARILKLIETSADKQ